MEHGTRARYVHKRCRCKRCKAANAHYRREHKSLVRMHAKLPTQPPRYVEAGYARAIAVTLIEDGADAHWIAAQAGVTRDCIARILSGERKRTYHKTLAKLNRLAWDVWTGKLCIPGMLPMAPDAAFAALGFDRVDRGVRMAERPAA